MLDKCVKSQKKFLYIVLFCKVKLSKMASIKLNEMKKDSTFLFKFFKLFFGPIKISQL